MDRSELLKKHSAHRKMFSETGWVSSTRDPSDVVGSRNKIQRNQIIAMCLDLVRSSLARSLLNPMVNADGNEPVAEHKEPSDARTSTTTERPGAGNSPDDACLATDEHKGNSGVRSPGNSDAWTGRPCPRSGDPRHRAEGGLSLPATRHRPLLLRGRPDRMHPRRHHPHGLPEPELPWSAPSTSHSASSIGPARYRRALCRQHRFEARASTE